MVLIYLLTGRCNVVLVEKELLFQHAYFVLFLKLLWLQKTTCR